MLKKIYKLNSEELKTIFNKKNTSIKIIRGVFFDLKYIKKDEFENVKFSIILSSKNFKKAIIRNKVKRIFFSIIKDWQKDNNLFDSIQILIYPKKEVLNLLFLELKKEVYNSLNKIK